MVEIFIRIHESIAPTEEDLAGRKAIGAIIASELEPDITQDAAKSGMGLENGGNELQLLNELVSDLEPASSMQEACDTVSRYLMRLMPSTLCVFYLYDSENDELVAKHASGASFEKAVGLRIPLGHSLSGWVGSNRSTIRNSDPTLDFGDRINEFTPAPHSCLSTPLVSDNDLVGVLSLYAPARNAFSEDHHRIVEMVSALTSQVLQDTAAGDTGTAVELVCPPTGPHPRPRHRE